jgi:hypothetical protein
MAKTAIQGPKKNSPRSPLGNKPAQNKIADEKSKVELAKEYLNKFHPGWDTYLQSSN